MDVAGFTVSVGGWKNFILNRLPAFELKDGTLSVDQEMDLRSAVYILWQIHPRIKYQLKI